MLLTVTGKLGKSLTTIMKMDPTMLFWLTNSWCKQATEQSPLTSARYCIRVYIGLYRNAQSIRSWGRCKEHAIASFFILMNWSSWVVPNCIASLTLLELHVSCRVCPVLRSIWNQHQECLSGDYWLACVKCCSCLIYTHMQFPLQLLWKMLLCIQR